MEKPGLGRGLASLLGGDSRFGKTTPKSQAEGFQLLLRGDDGKELVTPAEKPMEPEAAGAPRWVLGAALAMDVVLVVVALWAEVATRGWMRHAVAALMVAVGACILGLAAWLRGRPAARDLASLNPLSEDAPRLRVRFMDEQPRRR
jgi:hypothetical protein